MIMSTLYQCVDCGFRWLPAEESEFQTRFLKLVDANGNFIEGWTMRVRVCKSRKDCMRRTLDKVGDGDQMVRFLKGVVGKPLA